MTLTSRALVLASLIVLATLLSACSESSSRSDTESRAVGTTGTTPAQIEVQVNSMFVTIENRAGQALLDTQVAIKAAGGTPFTTTLRRLESGEKRELPVGEFVNANGLPFNPRSARPREVTVAATDLVGKDYEVTVPWTR